MFFLSESYREEEEEEECMYVNGRPCGFAHGKKASDWAKGRGPWMDLVSQPREQNCNNYVNYVVLIITLSNISLL